jgi:hypothetical protein
MNKALTRQCEALWNAGKIQTRNPELIGHILGIDVPIRNIDFETAPFSQYSNESYNIETNDATDIVPSDNLFTFIIDHHLMIAFKEDDFFIEKFDGFAQGDREYLYVYYDFPANTIIFSEAYSEKITDMYSYNGYIFIAQNTDKTLFKLQKVS